MATTTTPGGVDGWVDQTAVAQGQAAALLPFGSSGGPILQSSTDYIAATLDGQNFSYFTNSTTAYQNDDGTGAEVTSYQYTFYLSSAAVTAPTIETETTILPVVSTSQHGSGQANSTTDVYDTFGRVVWSKDAAGVISYTEYDQNTGAVVEQIQDVSCRTPPTLRPAI